MPAPMTEWKAFAFKVPGKDLLKQVRAVLETLLIFLEVLKTILETIKTFLIDFGNPIKALVEALIKLILALLESLRRTGIYLYLDVPDFVTDPNMRRQKGGYRGFTSRWKGSLLDNRDANRPQPIKNALKGGFIIILADATGTNELVRIIRILMKFFCMDFIMPHYPPPANVKAVPVGEKGDPILAVTKIFKRQVTAIAVEWSLPTTTNVPDPYFENLASQISTEFYPPKFLIERSTVPVVRELDYATLKPTDVGYLTLNVPTDFEDKGMPGVQKKRKIRLKDEYGDPFIKFQQYVIVSLTENSASFLLGQLGTFRWIDTSVEMDKNYYYRVRAFSGDLQLNSDNTVNLKVVAQPQKESGAAGGNLIVQWPGEPVMGRASKIIKGRIVKLPDKFDVLENIRRVFLVAHSFDFHLPQDPGVKFDQNGMPVAPTLPTQVGLGTLFGKSSGLGGETFKTTAGLIQSNAPLNNSVTGKLEPMPWQMPSVRYASARLAIKIAAAMLENGSTFIGQFQSLMQGLYPKGKPQIGGTLDNANNMEQMVAALTKVDFNESVLEKAQGVVTDIVFRTGTVDEETIKTYGRAFSDAVTRANVASVVDFLMNLAYGGVPPNWEQAALLRDLIPWSGQMLYDLVAKIQALLDAFKGVLDEIKQFIDLIIRKINVLEQFIKFLISILNFIESLSVGFYMLTATGLTGDVTDWFAAVDNAQGKIPPSGPTGYSAGISLAYLAIDVAAFETAFKLIF